MSMFKDEIKKRVVRVWDVTGFFFFGLRFKKILVIFYLISLIKILVCGADVIVLFYVYVYVCFVRFISFD